MVNMISAAVNNSVMQGEEQIQNIISHRFFSKSKC